jgi:acylglycerol lipase
VRALSPLPRLLTLLASLLGCACAPVINRPGQPVQAPRLARGHFVAADGAVLPVRSWLPAENPPRAVIVALHGFNDYSRFFEAPGRYLSGKGIACYAYDQRGFGNAPGRGFWPGIAAYTDDLADFTGEARKRHPGVPLVVLGESMGGAVAMVAMTGPRPPRVEGVILSAPAVWGRDTMPWYQTWLLAVTSHTVPWLTLTGEGLRILPSDNLEMLRGLGRDPLVIKATRIDAMAGLTDLMDEALARSARLKLATLILYGDRDQVIPRAPVLRMLETLGDDPAVRTAFYERGYHMLLRDLSAEKPLSDITAWIGDHRAPLPSGADRRSPKVHGKSADSLAALRPNGLRQSAISPP